MAELIPPGRPSMPWGGDPPPAPAHASRADRRRVRSAWRLWSHFRPVYDREGEEVIAMIDLKGNGWVGRGRGPSEEEAAWNALQDCIRNWRRDITPLWAAVRRRPQNRR